jgi:hypothetical protein
MKTAEQSEQDRAAAREAVRRHRKRLKAEREAMLGTPRYWAIHRINRALREMIYGKVGSGGQVQTRDRTDALATALIEALGAESAAKLAARLAEEIDSSSGEDRPGQYAQAQAREREDDSKAETFAPEATRKLDRLQPFGELFGDDRGRAFVQDGIYFRSDGTEADRG